MAEVAKYLVFAVGLKTIDEFESTNGWLLHAIEGSPANCLQRFQTLFPDLEFEDFFDSVNTDSPGEPDLMYFNETFLPLVRAVPHDENKLYDKIVIVKLPTQPINFENANLQAVVPAAPVAGGNNNGVEIPNENHIVLAYNPAMSGGSKKRRRSTRRKQRKAGTRRRR